MNSNPSGGKHGKMQLVQVRRIGDHFDLGNLTMPDCEPYHVQQTPARGYYDPHRAIHEHRLRERRTGAVGSGELPGDNSCTTTFPGRSTRNRNVVGPECDIWSEDR